MYVCTQVTEKAVQWIFLQTLFFQKFHNHTWSTYLPKKLNTQDPTLQSWVMCNASAVKFYNVTSNAVRFENKIIFFLFEKTL
jgi:hypothetical protein